MSQPGSASLALLLLRVFVGVAFILHGYGKVRIIRGFAAKFALSVPLAGFVTVAQLAGGVMLVLGALTSIAAAAIAITMVGAVYKCMGRGERFIDPEHHSWESAAFYFVAATVLVLLGPGTYSIDHVLFG